MVCSQSGTGIGREWNVVPCCLVCGHTTFVLYRFVFSLHIFGVDARKFTEIGEIHGERARLENKTTAEKTPCFAPIRIFPVGKRENRNKCEDGQS